MWPFLTVVAVVVAAVVYFVFKGRLQQMRLAYETQIAALRAQTRENAEKLQAQQRALLNSMTEGLLVLDDGDAVQLTNRALHQMFSLTEPIVGKTVLEAFRLHSLSTIVEELKSKGTVLGLELEVPALQTDKNHWLQVNAATVLDDDKRRLGTVLVFRDVTRLKQLENTRREFVANVSHELRTPLSMIKGYAETLLGGAVSDPEVSTRFLQTIERHSDRLTNLINDLLVISQLEAGQMKLDLQAASIRQLVESVIQDLRERAEERQVSISNNVDSAFMVQADLERLRQVLWNLIENAIKYGKKQGRVIVDSAPASAGYIEISVADDGPGIPQPALPRIFERFYRVDKARSREAGGTGLGLSIVKHIVQAHGGRTWVESELGKGTTFYFTVQQSS